MDIRQHIIRGVARVAIKVAIGVALLSSAWAMGREYGLARHEFQIVVTAYGPGPKAVSFVCEKGCDWTSTDLGCGARSCSYNLSARDGILGGDGARVK